jgi:putative membrane protein
MLGIIVRTAIIMLGLFVAATLVPGVRIEGFGNFLIAGLLFAIVNAIIRPIAFVLTLPITVVTLGLFLLVLNAAMFGMVAWLHGGFEVSGFWAALFGALIVSIVSTVASWMIGPQGRYEIYVARRR